MEEAGAGIGSSGGARYKLMSPAKLPISRSASINIPPGLSPTSFLDSPILLSNVKPEPSPTTGSFFNQRARGAVGANSYSATSLSSTTPGERKSSDFEFILPVRPNKVPADVNFQRGEQLNPVQPQTQAQLFISSPRVKGDTAASSNELQLSAPTHTATSASGAPGEDDLNPIVSSIIGLQVSQSDNKGGNGSPTLSDDGYNWRKYGQKHVKGSEFPRSYYKCTHPNCEVKKLFERSHDGQITEIIYKGTHDHPKPQPNCRYNAGAVFPVRDGSDKVSSFPAREGAENSGAYGQASPNMEPSSTPELSPAAGNVDNADGGEDDDPFSKRRRLEAGIFDVTPVMKPIREPRVVVQTLSEVDILDDGYRWRKYGQKVVRGNPNPRSYYKCTNAGCPVRKHVERASHDPKAVITTYEGKHYHDVPTAKSSSHDTSGPAAGNGLSRVRSDERETISLDLGVGIGSAAENRSNEQQQEQSRLAQSQIQASASNFRMVRPVAYYRVINGGVNAYGSSQSPGKGHVVEIMPLNHSPYPYPQNLGRLVTGP